MGNDLDAVFDSLKSSARIHIGNKIEEGQMDLEGIMAALDVAIDNTKRNYRRRKRGFIRDLMANEKYGRILYGSARGYAQVDFMDGNLSLHPDLDPSEHKDARKKTYQETRARNIGAKLGDLWTNDEIMTSGSTFRDSLAEYEKAIRLGKEDAPLPKGNFQAKIHGSYLKNGNYMIQMFYLDNTHKRTRSYVKFLVFVPQQDIDKVIPYLKSHPVEFVEAFKERFEKFDNSKGFLRLDSGSTHQIKYFAE